MSQACSSALLGERPRPEGEVCCGFGGASSLEHPEVAREIAARKLDNVAQTEATVLVTDNPGCALHLRGAAHARDMRLRVAHVAEILADRLGATRSGDRRAGTTP